MLVVIVAQQIYFWTRQRAASCISISRDMQEVRLYKYLNRTPDARVSRVWAAIIKIRRTYCFLYFFSPSLSLSLFSLPLCRYVVTHFE